MALKKIERRHPGTKLSLRSHAVAIGTMFLLLAACGDDGSSNGPSNNGSSESDIMAVTFDDLPVCTAKREGVVAYVKDEKTAYICVDSDWTADSEDDKSSSNEKDATSSSSSVIKSSSSSSTDSSKTSSSDSEVSSSSSLKTASSSSVLSSSSWSSEGTIGSSSSIDLAKSSSSVKDESSSSVIPGADPESSSVSSSSSSESDIRDCATCCASGVILCGEESSSSIDLVQSSSSVKDESSSSVIPGSDPESSSSSVELDCSALLEGTDGWSWHIPKECRFNSDITYGTMTDKRDNQTYKTVKIGDQTWMAENLNYADSAKTPSLLKRSWCYNNKAENCDVAGRLYTWAAAIDSVKLATDADNPQDCGYRKTCTLPATVQGICPDGWHLPSPTEWEVLFTAVGGISTAGKILKSQTGWYDDGNGTDGVGFSTLPAGRRFSDGNFNYDGNNTYLWSATESGSVTACYMFLYYSYEDADLRNLAKDNAFSVRCLQNQQ